jgi:hypothetical protein
MVARDSRIGIHDSVSFQARFRKQKRREREKEADRSTHILENGARPRFCDMEEERRWWQRRPSEIL